MKMNIIFDDRSAIKAKCKDSDVRSDKWPAVVIDGIYMKMKRQMKVLVRISCANVIRRDIVRQGGEGTR